MNRWLWVGWAWIRKLNEVHEIPHMRKHITSLCPHYSGDPEDQWRSTHAPAMTVLQVFYSKGNSIYRMKTTKKHTKAFPFHYKLKNNSDTMLSLSTVFPTETIHWIDSYCCSCCLAFIIWAFIWLHQSMDVSIIYFSVFLITFLKKKIQLSQTSHLSKSFFFFTSKPLKTSHRHQPAVSERNQARPASKSWNMF